MDDKVKDLGIVTPTNAQHFDQLNSNAWGFVCICDALLSQHEPGSKLANIPLEVFFTRGFLFFCMAIHKRTSTEGIYSGVMLGHLKDIFKNNNSSFRVQITQLSLCRVVWARLYCLL